MRGVVMTETGEALKTPAPFKVPVQEEGAGLSKIIMESPQVGLNFRKIFDFESETEDEEDEDEERDGEEDATVTADEDDEEKQLTTSGASSASSSSSGSSSGDRGFVSREAFAPLDPNTPSKPLLAKARMRSSK